MGLAIRILRESLADTAPRPRQPLGVIHLRLLGLDDLSFTISIDRRVTVSDGAPSSSDLRLYCSSRQLDALIESNTLASVRYDGNRDLLEHLALLLTAGSSLLAVRQRHAAHHHAAHFRDDL